MSIAIIGWGSLIWKPDGLPMSGQWQHGGLVLKIEFSRVSDDGRLTLVVDEVNGVDVPTQYVLSPRTNLADAIEDLREREGTITKRIGFVDVVNHQQYREIHPTQTAAVTRITEWAQAKGMQAVVWTALPSNFEGRTGIAFSVDRAVAYLQGLTGTARQQAVEYIRSAPAEVVTPLRRTLVAAGLI